MLYSVILPTYNERENLPIIYYLIDKVFNEAKLSYEVVIVDDSSPDNTLEVAQAIQKSYGEKHVQIVSRKGKLGLGTAYIAGLKAAKGERVILMDADLSHHPKFIPQMVELMDKTKVPIITGTRYALGGGVYGWDMKRKLTRYVRKEIMRTRDLYVWLPLVDCCDTSGYFSLQLKIHRNLFLSTRKLSKGANFLADFLLNPGVSDLTGSFRLYERKVLEKILPQIQCKGYAFQMEIIVRSKKAGFQVNEVPITFVDRIYGESKLGTKEIIMYIQGLMQLFFTT